MEKGLYIYALWQPTVYSTSFRFIPVHQLPSHGFSSTYLVSAAEADAITKSGSKAGFKGTVWSERLWIDVDNYDDARSIKEQLEKDGYDFICYDSGNRGFHFGLRRAASPTHFLPELDKEWVRSAYPDLAKRGAVDTSIYKNLNLFRCPGGRHEKSGRFKELIASAVGTRTLDFTGKSPSESRQSRVVANKSGSSIFDDSYISLLTVPAHNGQRHKALVRLAYALKGRGEQQEIAMWYLLELNKWFEVPKEEAEVEQIVESIYNK